MRLAELVDATTNETLGDVLTPLRPSRAAPLVAVHAALVLPWVKVVLRNKMSTPVSLYVGLMTLHATGVPLPEKKRVRMIPTAAAADDDEKDVMRVPFEAPEIGNEAPAPLPARKPST